MSGKPSSTARTRAWCRCWRGPVVLPNQPSLVTLSMSAGRSEPCTIVAREDGLVADERRGGGQARHAQAAGAALTPMSKPPRRRVSCSQPDRLQLPLQRQVFAERHQVDLVVERGQDPPWPNTMRLLKMRRGRGEPGGAGSARSAPVIRWVAGGSRRPMAARTSGIVERQEGHGGFRPDHVRDAGEVVDLARGVGGRQRHVIEEDALLVLGAPLLALRHARLHDADLDARHASPAAPAPGGPGRAVRRRRAAPGPRPAPRPCTRRPAMPAGASAHSTGGRAKTRTATSVSP